MAKHAIEKHRQKVYTILPTALHILAVTFALVARRKATVVRFLIVWDQGQKKSICWGWRQAKHVARAQFKELFPGCFPKNAVAPLGLVLFYVSSLPIGLSELYTV